MNNEGQFFAIPIIETKFFYELKKSLQFAFHFRIKDNFFVLLLQGYK